MDPHCLNFEVFFHYSFNAWRQLLFQLRIASVRQTDCSRQTPSTNILSICTTTCCGGSNQQNVQKTGSLYYSFSKIKIEEKRKRIVLAEYYLFSCFSPEVEQDWAGQMSDQYSVHSILLNATAPNTPPLTPIVAPLSWSSVACAF